MNTVKLFKGDNIKSLKSLPDNSIDSVVTDPPYGLSFMNKKWDYDVPSVEFWKEVYRVLKPGGHVLSFGGTRTYHRMVINIEDAGFEIRDQIQWIYGSGFPKGHNIGKAVDKIEGNERDVVGIKENWHELKGTNDRFYVNKRVDLPITKGQSEWEGWRTSLKPANEPICVARKPLSEKSVAENVLKWRTGGINIDGCRVGNENMSYVRKEKDKGIIGFETRFLAGLSEYESDITEGRFPANIILDETAAEMLDKQSGISKSNPDNRKEKKATGEMFGTCKITSHNDKGGASRFFYVAKVSKKERNMGLEESLSVKKNSHPTVKPITLMTYLCRLVTPPNGIVLDPFMGSGSTGIAARLEGFRFCGMEMDPEYFKIAEARIENYEKYRELLK